MSFKICKILEIINYFIIFNSITSLEILQNHPCQTSTIHYNHKKNSVIINFNRAINYYNHCLLNLKKYVMCVTIAFNFALNYNMFNSLTFKYECINHTTTRSSLFSIETY